MLIYTIYYLTWQDGSLDPSAVHVKGVPTEEEERQLAEEKRLGSS